MKNTGIVRKMDELGRIVIPKELRKTLQIAEGDPLEIWRDGDSIMLRKHQTSCVFCGEADQRKLLPYKGKQVCDNCAINLQEGR